MQTLDRPCDHSHFIPFLDGAVIYRKGHQHLWVLNHSSAYIWCSLPDFDSESALARHLGEVFGIPADVATNDLSLTLQSFRTEGLLQGYENNTSAPSLAKPCTLTSTLYQIKTFPELNVSFQLDLNNRCIGIRSNEQEVSNSLYSLFERMKSEKPPEMTYTLLCKQPTPDRYTVYLDQYRLEPDLSKDEVLPALFTLVFMALSSSFDEELIFHASVVAKDGIALVFPAESGSGKSTLAASLCANSWQFFSDELAIIDKETLHASPFPLPLSAKPEGVPALLDYYPGLHEITPHLRHDGKWVRYFTPDKHLIAEQGDSASIGALIFPQYRPDLDKPQLIPTDKNQALRKLAHNSSCERPMTLQDAKTLVSLVSSTACYSLLHNDLERSRDLLEKLIDDLKRSHNSAE